MPKNPGEGSFEDVPIEDDPTKDLGLRRPVEPTIRRLPDNDWAKLQALQRGGETPTQPDHSPTDGIGSVESLAVEEVIPIEPASVRRPQARGESVWDSAKRAPSTPDISGIPPADTGAMLALKVGSSRERRHEQTAVVRESARRVPFEDRGTMMQKVPEGVQEEVTEKEFGSYALAHKKIMAARADIVDNYETHGFSNATDAEKFWMYKIREAAGKSINIPPGLLKTTYQKNFAAQIPKVYLRQFLIGWYDHVSRVQGATSPTVPAEEKTTPTPEREPQEGGRIGNWFSSLRKKWGL